MTDSFTHCQTVGNLAYKRPEEDFEVIKVARRHFSINKVGLVTLGMVDKMDMVDNVNMVKSSRHLKMM